MCARNLKVWDLRCNGLTRNTSLSGVAAEASRSPVAPRAPELDGFVAGTLPSTACHTFHTITDMYRESQGLRSVHGGVSGTNPSNSDGVQGYFGGGAYMITLLIIKTPSPPRTNIGPWAWPYCRVLGGAFSYERGTPVRAGVARGVAGDARSHHEPGRHTHTLSLSFSLTHTQTHTHRHRHRHRHILL